VCGTWEKSSVESSRLQQLECAYERAYVCAGVCMHLSNMHASHLRSMHSPHVAVNKHIQREKENANDKSNLAQKYPLTSNG